MKLALGTVQFGLDYGISNKLGRTSESEVSEILKFAQNSGIQVIDTASFYGQSEKVLGQCPRIKNFKIITKSKTFEDRREISKSDGLGLLKCFEGSLKFLNCSVIEGLLIHHIDDLLKPGGEYLYEALLSLREQRKVQKIGVSVYTAEEISNVLENYSIDLIQLPASILDQRLLKNDILKQLKVANVEIHVRSAFLQGLIFMDPKKLSKHFIKSISLLTELKEELKSRELSPACAALGFLSEIKEIDQIVCGVNNVSQLRELVEVISVKGDFNWLKDFAIDDEMIVNPGNWRN